VVRRSGQKICDEFDQTHVPDPVSQEFCKIRIQLDRIQKENQELKQALRSRETNKTETEQ
jgi:serine O-acetyltransferase